MISRYFTLLSPLRLVVGIESVLGVVGLHSHLLLLNLVGRTKFLMYVPMVGSISLVAESLQLNSSLVVVVD